MNIRIVWKKQGKYDVFTYQLFALADVLHLQFHFDSVTINQQNRIRKKKPSISLIDLIYLYQAYRDCVKHTPKYSQWLSKWLKRILVTKFYLHSKVGLPDAPQTAIVSSIIWLCKSFILRYVQMKCKVNEQGVFSIHVEPSYNRPLIAFSLEVKARLSSVRFIMALMHLIWILIKNPKSLRFWWRLLQRLLNIKNSSV